MIDLTERATSLPHTKTTFPLHFLSFSASLLSLSVLLCAPGSSDVSRWFGFTRV